MVSATLIQLFAKGPIDKVMYGNPQVTYFKCVYKRPTNFACQYIYKNFTGEVDWDRQLITTVPREGDLLGGIYIRIKLDDLQRKYLYFYTGDVTSAASSNESGFIVGSSVTDVAHLNSILSSYLPGIESPDMLQTSYEDGENIYTKDPQFTSFVNGLGAAIIEEISIWVGNKLLEKIPGELLFIDNELHNYNNSKSMFYDSVYYTSTYFDIGVTNTKNIDLMIPIPFFFSKDSGLNLPILAMHNENIQVKVKLRKFEDCLIRKYQNNPNPQNAPGTNGLFWFTAAQENSVTQTEGYPYIYPGEINGPWTFRPVATGTKYDEEVVSNIKSVDIIYKFIHLDDSEKIHFLSRKNSYLIPTLNQATEQDFIYNEGATQFIPIELRNPVRYITFVLQRKDNYDDHDYFNYTTINHLKNQDNRNLSLPNKNDYILDEFNLSIENVELFDKIPSKVLNNIELYTKFKNNSSPLIYVYSFALYPNEINPSGTLNFSQIRDQFIKLKLVNPTIFDNKEILFRCYYSSYNILTIDEGLTAFRFY